jgi:hypothetical protein
MMHPLSYRQNLAIAVVDASKTTIQLIKNSV